MEKFLKRVLICILALTLIVSNIVVSNVNASDNEAEEFSGRRRIVYMASKSDLDNFVDGGRAAFDLLLRKNAPKWLIYDITAKDRDVYASFEFEFTSFEDYEEKLKELLTYSPTLVKDDSSDMLLLEGHSALDLMNFLQSVLGSLNNFNDEAIEKTFEVTENVIKLNNEEYKTIGERLAIRPSGEEVVKLDELAINTYSTEKNTYSRSILVKVDDAVDLEKVLGRFEQIGVVEGEDILGEKQIKVTFEAGTIAELSKKTMECLNVSISISEHQNYVSDEIVGVTCTEYINLAELLNEDGTYLYAFEYPKYYSNVSSDDENISAEEGKITAKNSSSVSYYYERGFKFSSIEIDTDLSNLLGKKARTISLVIPTDVGVYYHDLIKEWSQEQMINGTTLDIFDESGNRYYQFVFSSWFWNDITKFTQEILNGVCVLEIEEAWIPWGKNSLQEKISVGALISNTAPINEISVSYTLQEFSKVVLRETKKNANSILDDKTVLFQIGNGEKINFSYREISLMKCIIELLAIMFIIILLLVLKKSVTRRSKKEMYCSNCGRVVQPKQEFCGKCGNRLK